VKRPESPIVGPEVADQSRLRPQTAVRDLDEFLEFLARVEAIFGPIRRARRPTTGERFLL
jgi:hypothetical protein